MELVAVMAHARVKRDGVELTVMLNYAQLIALPLLIPLVATMALAHVKTAFMDLPAT